MGLRRLVAKAATFAYPGQAFSVDRDGHWVNEQAECTIVSPVMHTASFAGFGNWVRDNWLYRYTPKPGDIIVDLGTGIGEEAVVFSKLIGDGTMLAVEAHPVVHQCLTKTIVRSGIANVRPIHCAVGAEEGSIIIDDGESFLTGSIMSTQNGVRVPMVTLDALTKDLPRIDFLRTNIEGAERLMLVGMTNSVQKVRNLCISCHDFLGKPEARSRADVISFLEQNGFVVSTRPGTPAPMCDYVYGSRH